MTLCNLRYLFSNSLEFSPDVTILIWVIGAASRDFKQINCLKKRSKSGGNLKISLIIVSYMASCNFRNLFLDAWNLVQLYYFWNGKLKFLGNFRNSKNIFLKVWSLVQIYYFLNWVIGVTSRDFR